MTTRRQVMGGIGAGLALAPWPGARSAVAAAPDKLFAGTPLAANRVAASFTRVDLALPDVVVTTGRGQLRPAPACRHARLMTLWAEWCTPACSKRATWRRRG